MAQDPGTSRKRKNYALLAVLLFLVALFYGLAILKMGRTI